MTADPLRTEQQSIPAALHQSARRGGSLTVLDRAMRPTRLTLDEIDDMSTGVAARLRRAGVGPGDRVCVLAPTSAELLLNLFGLWRLGAVPVVLPHERTDDAGPAGGLLGHRIATSGAEVVLTDRAPRLSTRVPAGCRVLPLDTTLSGPRAPEPAVPDGSALGLLQFTSGTTGSSKAVPVRQGQLVGNVLACMAALGMRPGHTYVSWLPFYHDMGIVSVVGLLVQGVHTVVMPTENFLSRPSSWLETVTAHRAEITAAPNSAYRLAVKAQQLRPAALDLSRLRVAINGAEPVTADTVEETTRVLGKSGMPAEALCPTYGMAETTLVVTAAPATAPVRVLDPDEVPRQHGHHELPARPLVSCGTPLPGTGVTVHGPDGEPLPDGQVGEVRVTGPGVTDGYWTGPGAALDGMDRLTDGRMHTGDLGFLHEGELYVCGRAKDMIIVGGRNLYPEDYEIVAEAVPGVRGGNVIAFSLPDQERMVVVAEGTGGAASQDRLARDLFERLRGAAQHAPAEVVLVRPATLPKTSSGKKRRGTCRDRYLAGELDVVATAH
ncbi:AMP-binding protein [Streptomyces sp. TRM S81-3]|uniref:AMP-binding protein n=1 Tax=Streptomyces griseicoloratus TaxID=2752516 RepID=A0A926L0L2_9ACTN|nr:AMP-binding protein [Streptomyces griseicoloratus]MBD0420193.1 AMP-binding protein [Streptomyces griseicoloratus]